MFGWFKKRRERKKLISELGHISQHVAPFYNIYSIRKKSGGTRRISAPVDEVKRAQKMLLKKYLYGLSCAREAHGFIRGKSIKSAALPHKNCAVLVAIDIKDFFPSITTEMVKSLFQNSVKELQNDEELLNLILEILTHRGSLPQGSPASPTISNLIFKEIDGELRAIALRFNARYTRYADDLYFSSKVYPSLAKIIPGVEKILKNHGFILNSEKSRVSRRGQRQVVAGVVVNNGVSVGRKKIRILRAEIDKFEKALLSRNIEAATAMIPKITGKIAHYGFINKSSIFKLKTKFLTLQKKYIEKP
jgi:RNA-directed DNA polymerase